MPEGERSATEVNPQEKFRQRVSEAEEIDDLIVACNKIETIESEQQPGITYAGVSQGEKVEMAREAYREMDQSLINQIVDMPPLLQYLTSSGGLRDKFLELLKEGKR